MQLRGDDIESASEWFSSLADSVQDAVLAELKDAVVRILYEIGQVSAGPADFGLNAPPGFHSRNSLN